MLGALARIDVLRCPGATIYLTAWLSDQIPCHLGKTDAADERCVLPSVISDDSSRSVCHSSPSVAIMPHLSLCSDNSTAKCQDASL